MNGIQILLITGVVLVAVYFFVRLHNSVADILLLLGLVSAATIFIFFPDATNRIAHRLGVGRGADLVFYLSIVIFWFVILKLYVRIRQLEKIVTDVVRKDALNEAGKASSTDY
jgi:small membrane protein